MAETILIVTFVVGFGIWALGVGFLVKLGVGEWRQWNGDRFMGTLALVAAIVVFGLPFTFWALGAVSPPAKPCVREETSTRYDPALKVMRPMKYCAQYGEWTDK